MTEMCKLDKTIMETKLPLARLNPIELSFVNKVIENKVGCYSAVKNVLLL